MQSQCNKSTINSVESSGTNIVPKVIFLGDFSAGGEEHKANIYSLNMLPLFIPTQNLLSDNSIPKITTLISNRVKYI